MEKIYNITENGYLTAIYEGSFYLYTGCFIIDCQYERKRTLVMFYEKSSHKRMSELASFSRYRVSKF